MISYIHSVTYNFVYWNAKRVVVWIFSEQFLNQTCMGCRPVPGFLKSFHPRTLVYVCVCVSAPKAINNKSHERHA